ncbi:MAG: efflux transporter outer membrane subunit, partial [Burkholderiales bacterium]|nr:efflux transporter outer membrane subunit [Burkholderiales bacterium]
PVAAASALPADRWGVFGEPELLRLQALAVGSSPDLKLAALHLAQARAAEATVSAQRGVRVAANAAAMRQRQSEYGASARLVGALGGPNQQHLLQELSAPYSQYDAGFDASWEPDFWGRIQRSEEAAAAASAQGAAALRSARLSVAAEVARSWFALRSAQDQIALTQRELGAAEQARALLQARFEQGLSDASALIDQRAKIAALQSTAPALQVQEALALNQLTLLCGLDPGALNRELAAAPAEGRPTLPDLRLGLPAELARRRPDIAAAEARLHEATAEIGVAVADLYPRITLGANFGLESIGSGRFGEWGSRQWSVGPSLSIPVWDQGRRRTTIQLRRLQQQEAAVAFQQTVLKAWHEVDDSISAYVAEGRRETRLAARLAEAGQQAALARARYAQGLASYLPVLATETTQIEARRDLDLSQTRRRTALVALYKALGDDGSDAALAAR